MQPIEIEHALDLIQQAATKVVGINGNADLDSAESQAEFINRFPNATESVRLGDAVGRSLATTISAPFDHPPFDQALRDGIALKHDANNLSRQLVGTVFAGQSSQHSITVNQATKIMTGAPMPNGADCVAMVEDLVWIQKEMENDLNSDLQPNALKNLWDGSDVATQVRLMKPTSPAQFVLPKGSLFSQGQILLHKNQVLTPAAIGLLASTGLDQVEVFRPLRVSLLITGDEVRPAGETLSGGQIYNSNGPLLEALVKRNDLELHRSDCIGDDAAELENWLRMAIADSDLVITTGGVSAGQKDLLPELFAKTGVQKQFHGVRIKPGKPVWFGTTQSPNCFVFGLPGNPVSCQICFTVFVQSLIRFLNSSKPDAKDQVAKLSEDWSISGNRATFWPGRWIETDINSSPTIQPLPWQGSADLVSPTTADALILFDPNAKRSSSDSEVGQSNDQQNTQWKSNELVQVFDY